MRTTGRRSIDAERWGNGKRTDQRLPRPSRRRIRCIALIVALLGLAAAGLIRRDSRRSALAAGALVGAGAVYVYGAINTTLACLDDRCGGADPWPLVLFAVAVFGFGLVTIALSLIRRR